MAAKLTALYYPHIAIENDSFLKNALLLWDNVDLICPFRKLPSRQGGSAGAIKAFQKLARPLDPSEEDKQNAHDAIMELANSELPDWFFPAHVEAGLRYHLFPGKLLDKTWRELRKSRLATPKIIDADPPLPRSAMQKLRQKAEQESYETTQAFGLTVMSILADCSAGSTRQLVTDEIDSYVALDRYLKLIGGVKADKDAKADHDRLATISLRTLDLSRISINTLVRIRDEESKKPALREMRHAYVDKIDAYKERLAQARKQSDIEEIDRLFEEEVADDIGLLKEELKDEAKQLIFSNEMIATATIALAGTAINPVLGQFAAAAGLYRAKSKYHATRNKTLANHPMSWLYEIQRFKVL